MKEHGIIFNSEMVRAILTGKKTQTRKVMKTQPRPSEIRDGDYWFPCDRVQSMVHISDFIPGNSAMPDAHEFFSACCPLGGAGDRIWVRETFQVGLCIESTFAYKATHKSSDPDEGWGEAIKWRPSTQMPRWASRITLEITNVRVERLQAASDNDFKAEGYPLERELTGGSTDAFCWFRHLWDSVSKPDCNYESNPWVWVIEFKKVK